MKIYVAGPISGRVSRNRVEFERVAEMVRTPGHDVRIPHEFGERAREDVCQLPWAPRAITDTPAPSQQELWRDWMWYDLHALTAWRPSAVVLLEDWAESRGAVATAALFSALCLRTLVNRGIGFFESSLPGPVVLDVPRTWFWAEAQDGVPARMVHGAETPAGDPFETGRDRRADPAPSRPRRGRAVASEADWLS